MINILLGTFWGFMEATLGGFLHFVKFPLTGSIMAPIGFSVLFIAMKRGSSAKHLALVTTIAASFKFLDVFLFGLSPFQMTIINPAQAILMQSLSFIAFTWLLKSDSPIKKLLASTLMVSLSVVLFNLIGYFVIGQTRVPLFSNPEATLTLHIPISIVMTYLLIELISRINQNVIDVITLKHSSFVVRATTCVLLIVVGLATQLYLH